jgi:hypothetical protein
MPIKMNENLKRLKEGKINIKGEFLWGSNYTFLTQISYKGITSLAVYKPTRGERPLWDFPAASLAHREVAAYLVSRSLGWDFVPETVYRLDGPLGEGSLQNYIDHTPDYHYFNFSVSDLQHLRSVALFDILINNADRKGSHMLFDQNGKLWLIDHGICFHVDDKLRTVVWDFAGESIPDNLSNDMRNFLERLGSREDTSTPVHMELSNHLNSKEIDAIRVRAEKLLLVGKFPSPDDTRRTFPWPQL